MSDHLPGLLLALTSEVSGGRNKVWRLFLSPPFSAEEWDPRSTAGAAVVRQGAGCFEERTKRWKEWAAERDEPALQQSDQHAAPTWQSPVSMSRNASALSLFLIWCVYVFTTTMSSLQAGVGAAFGAASDTAGFIWPAASRGQVWGWPGKTAAAGQAAGDW